MGQSQQIGLIGTQGLSGLGWKGQLQVPRLPSVARNDTKNDLNGICLAYECPLIFNLLNANWAAQDDNSCLWSCHLSAEIVSLCVDSD
jgi:hypothetical protein